MRDKIEFVTKENIAAANKQLKESGIEIQLGELRCACCQKVTQSLNNGLCDFCSPNVHTQGQIGHA